MEKKSERKGFLLCSNIQIRHRLQRIQHSILILLSPEMGFLIRHHCGRISGKELLIKN